MGIFKNKKADTQPLELRSFYPYVSQTFNSGTFGPELNACVDTAVSKISNTLSILPLELMVWTRNGKQEAWSHPVSRLLRDPATEEGSQLFWKTVIRHLLLKGNVYIFKHKYNGEVVSLEIIAPERMQPVRRSSDGRKIYTIVGSEKSTYTEDDVIQIAYQEEGYNGSTGKSPCEIHKNLVLKNTMISEYISLFFKNGMNSRLLVSLNEEFKPGSPKIQQVVSEFQQYFQTFVLGYDNAGKPIVTPPGSTITTLEMGSNVQTDVFNLYRQSCDEIYRMFNIPPEVIDSQESKYGSLEAKQQDFLINCIKPLALHICQTLEKALLKPNEQGRFTIQFNFDAMLDVDVQKKCDYLMKLFHGGLITLNEFRQKMSMSSIENEVEGNTRWMPANLIPATEENIKSILAKSKLALQEAEMTDAEKQEEKMDNHGPIEDQRI